VRGEGGGKVSLPRTDENSHIRLRPRDSKKVKKKAGKAAFWMTEGERRQQVRKMGKKKSDFKKKRTFAP